MLLQDLRFGYFVYLHRKYEGNREAMARESGVALRTIYNWLKDYGWEKRGGPREVPDHIDLIARSIATTESEIDAQRIAAEMANEALASPEIPPAKPWAYGYCPRCGAPGWERERSPDGDTTCKNGHKYPSRDSLLKPPAESDQPGVPG